MKLTVPAIRAAEPNPRRREVSEQTGVLLDAIDTLLAELATPSAYKAKNGPRMGIRGARELANLPLVGVGSGGPAGHTGSPIPPAA